MKKPVGRQVRKLVYKLKLVVSTRLAFLFLFTLFYWVYYFIYQRANLQLSQVVFNFSAGVFTGAVAHVAVAKFIGPLLFGRCFCGWACWNASLFDFLPVRKPKRLLPEKYYMYKYVVLAAVLALPFLLIYAGFTFQGRSAQFKWLLIENAVIYGLGILLAFVLGDRRAFCKYLCPAGALMTITSPRSILKIEKNHLHCNRCRKCEEICPMDVPILNYISANQRVSDPECILCIECVKSCPKNCLTVGLGHKSDTTPEFGRSY
ncbi:MAG: 4Fe-4S ferredoxin [Firmicutes bacterium HGW-Firmicutes-8]|nr:MAG: 4Fe-4S ferredoxin [Firmicutes bacterium HGW-Firmicutes-8]